MKTYQVYKGSFYVITSKTDSDVIIKDKATGIILGTAPAGGQALICAIGKQIETDGEIVLTIVR